jgi:predicted MFS family arabinose efflux permease
MAMFGAITFVPLYLQAVTGSSATEAGFVLMPFVIGWVACSILGARLVLRVSYRSVVVAGMLFLTLAFILLASWNESLTRGAAVRDMILAGVGMGLVFVPMLIAVQSAVPRSVLGSTTSVRASSAPSARRRRGGDGLGHGPASPPGASALRDGPWRCRRG